MEDRQAGLVCGVGFGAASGGVRDDGQHGGTRQHICWSDGSRAALSHLVGHLRLLDLLVVGLLDADGFLADDLGLRASEGTRTGSATFRGEMLSLSRTSSSHLLDGKLLVRLDLNLTSLLHCLLLDKGDLRVRVEYMRSLAHYLGANPRSLRYAPSSSSPTGLHRRSLASTCWAVA